MIAVQKIEHHKQVFRAKVKGEGLFECESSSRPNFFQNQGRNSNVIVKPCFMFSKSPKYSKASLPGRGDGVHCDVHEEEE